MPNERRRLRIQTTYFGVMSSDGSRPVVQCAPELRRVDGFRMSPELPERPLCMSKILKGKLQSKPAVWVCRLVKNSDRGSGEFFASQRVDSCQHDKLRFSSAKSSAACLPQFFESEFAWALSGLGEFFGGQYA